MNNAADDLLGQLVFLRMAPLTDKMRFRRFTDFSLNALAAAMRHITIRHTKEQSIQGARTVGSHAAQRKSAVTVPLFATVVSRVSRCRRSACLGGGLGMRVTRRRASGASAAAQDGQFGGSGVHARGARGVRQAAQGRRRGVQPPACHGRARHQHLALQNHECVTAHATLRDPVAVLRRPGVVEFALRCSRASTQPLRQATPLNQAEVSREGTTRAGLLLPLRRVCSGGCLSQKDLEVKAGGAGGGGAEGAGGDVQRPRGLLSCPDTVECSMCLEAPENPVRTCLMSTQRGLC